MGKDVKRHIWKEDRPIPNKHMKTYPSSLVIREVQTQTTTKYHFLHIKMTTIKFPQKIKKLKVELLNDPAIPFLRIYPKGEKTNKPITQKYIRIPLFIAELFTIARYENNLSIHGWLNK